MIVNAHITSWTPRSGSDAEGKPTYGAEQVTRPIPVLATAPNWAQARTAERESFTLDIILTLNAASVPATGDLIICDHPNVAGITLEVRKSGDGSKPGLRAVQLFCGRIG